LDLGGEQWLVSMFWNSLHSITYQRLPVSDWLLCLRKMLCKKGITLLASLTTYYNRSMYFLSLQYPTKPSLVPSTRAVLPPATRGAVLRETARLPQAATVMSPATTSATAVMISLQLAATVRTQ